MSLKRFILILIVLGAAAAVIVSFAAGGGDGGKRHQNGGVQSHQNGTHPAPVQRSRAENPDATEKFWTPDRMKRARPLPIGIPGGKKQPGGSGGDGGSSAPSHR
jgi:hypothetical protein